MPAVAGRIGRWSPALVLLGVVAVAVSRDFLPLGALFSLAGLAPPGRGSSRRRQSGDGGRGRRGKDATEFMNRNSYRRSLDGADRSHGIGETAGK